MEGIEGTKKNSKKNRGRLERGENTDQERDLKRRRGRGGGGGRGGAKGWGPGK